MYRRLVSSLFLLAVFGLVPFAAQAAVTSSSPLREPSAGIAVAATPSPTRTVTPSPTPLPPTSFDCRRVQGVTGEECEVLVGLYKNHGGPTWKHRDNWLIAESACTWYGVKCGAGHVVSLMLGENELTGAFPATVGQLVHLRRLGLYATSSPARYRRKSGNSACSSG